MPSRRDFVVLAVGAALAGASPFAWSQLQEGKQYERLRNPQPVESGNRVEVIEFFSYGCPHCADLEPFLGAWAKKLPADVQFRRVPVIFSSRWEGLARIYYTLDAMGLESKLAPAVFDAIHKDRVPLDQDKSFFDWAAKQGLDRAKVEEVYKSFGVGSKVSRSKALAQAYGINSVPTVVVDGKYITASDRVGGHSQLPAALDALIAKARSERPKS
jgi:thiol:disulfide interchange protein DsbA